MSTRFCHRCGHSWLARKSSPPLQCPKCTSPYWNLPRRSSVIATQVRHDQPHPQNGFWCENQRCMRFKTHLPSCHRFKSHPLTGENGAEGAQEG